MPFRLEKRTKRIGPIAYPTAFQINEAIKMQVLAKFLPHRITIPDGITMKNAKYNERFVLELLEKYHDRKVD